MGLAINIINDQGLWALSVPWTDSWGPGLINLHWKPLQHVYGQIILNNGKEKDK